MFAFQSGDFFPLSLSLSLPFIHLWNVLWLNIGWREIQCDDAEWTFYYVKSDEVEKIAIFILFFVWEFEEKTC